MSKNLITGAAGFIGSQLAHALWKKNEQVVLLDNFSYGQEDNLIFEDYDFRKEILREDVCNAEMLFDLCQKEQFDYIYHVAGITPLPDCQSRPGESTAVNIAGTLNVLEAARKFGIKNVIFASTSAVYENCKHFPTKEEDVVPPTLIYSTQKYTAELFCKSFADAYGMNVTVLRFANVFGPHIDCLRTQPPVTGYIIRELFYDRQPVLHSDGEQRRDFVYVDDLIELCLLVRENKGFDCVNVSTNSTHSINELYHCIAKYMNKSHIVPKYVDSSNYWRRYPSLYEGAYPISNNILEKEVVKYTMCDNSHAKNVYNWVPKVKFEEGVMRTVDFSVNLLKQVN